MARRKTVPRARQRQEMLRELAGGEVVCAMFGKGYSRAAEAVDALQRIQDGTYGVCSDCGKRIPAARLEIKPESARCVACQTEYERQSAAPIGDCDHVAVRSA